MKQMFWRKILVVSIILVLFGSSSISLGQMEKKSPIVKPLSHGNMLYVGGSGPNNYTSIQQAISDAQDGDTVFVYDDSSPYIEHILFTKSVNLIGENTATTIIDGDGYFYVVYIEKDLASGITFSGFTVQNGGDGLLLTSDFNTISNNIFKNNNWTGIRIYGNHNIIKNNFIENNSEGILVGVKGLIGSYPTKNNSILKNTLLNNRLDASFLTIFPNKNIWRHNYWDQPRFLPKIIKGDIYFIFIQDFLPWFAIDWRPALKLNDVS